MTGAGMHMGDHRLDRDGRFEGMVGGSLTVAAGRAVEVAGMVGGDLIVEPGAQVTVTGTVAGHTVRR